jgi:hypothetical protein
MRIIKGLNRVELVNRLRVPASTRTDDADVNLSEGLDGGPYELPASILLGDVSLEGKGAPPSALDVTDDGRGTYGARQIVHDDARTFSGER